MLLPAQSPRHPNRPSTPTQQHSWRFIGVRGGGSNVCERCGLVVTNFRNRETNHFELRYHRPEGLSEKAGKCE